MIYFAIAIMEEKRSVNNEYKHKKSDEVVFFMFVTTIDKIRTNIVI